jgi:hypothetical protein
MTQQWTPSGARWEVDPTANRLDISRSVLLDRAMGQGRPIWMFDADVVPFNQTYEEMLELIEDTIKRGYDAVVAPHASAGRVMIQPVDMEALKANPRPTEPFEITGGFNGMWYMSLRGLAKLEAIGYSETSDGRKAPMFCTFAMPGPDPENPRFAITEDFDLSLRFRASGGKIACDPRLKVAHLNKRDEVVDVQEMNRREAAAKAAIAQHEATLKLKGAKHVGN